MAEVMSFRFARSPQRLVHKTGIGLYPPPQEALTARAAVSRAKAPAGLLSQLVAAGTNASRTAQSHLSHPGFVGGGVALDAPLRELDSWLTGHANRIALGYHAGQYRKATSIERVGSDMSLPSAC